MLLALPGIAFAQNFVTFNPLNALTAEPLDSVHAQLTVSRGDSVTILASQFCRTNKNGSCSLVYPQGSGKFSLILYAEGYVNSAPREFTVKRDTKYYHTNLSNIMLERDFSRQLDEVTVTATKIKMVLKGDTIVYNADAFQLAQGSMLDALIRQLPGATLDKNGVITVQGRTVSSLLVDGRDFFKGSPAVALRNLPAYTVSQVKAYEKAPDYVIETGEAKPEYPLVLDVMLKQQYSVGWLGNLEGGYATHKRYMGRAFAMGYTKSTRIGVFGNVNNVNDVSAISNFSDNSWDESTNNLGRTSAQFVGTNINWEKKKDKYTHKIDADVKFSHENASNNSGSASTRYYESGNLYTRSTSSIHQGRTALSAGATYSIKAPQYFLRLMPRYEYARATRDALNIFSQLTALPSDTLLNQRTESAKNSTSHQLSLDWNWNYRRFNFSGRERYSTRKEDEHEYMTIRYSEDTQAANNQGQHIFAPRTTQNYQLRFHGDYNFWAGSESKFVHWQFIPEYTFQRDYSENDAPRYRMDYLPSAQTDLNLAIDRQNSLYSSMVEDSHQPGLRAIYGIFWKNDTEKFYLYPTIRDEIISERLHYVKPIHDTNLRLQRTTHSFKPNMRITFSVERTRWRYSLDGSYNYSALLPSLLSMIDTREDTDPLYVHLGNPYLNRGHRHVASFGLNYYHKKHRFMLNFNGNYNLMRGMVASAVYFDPETGVTTTRPKNINGNWNTFINMYARKQFDRWDVSARLQTSYNHSVDYVSVTNSPQRSLVHNWNPKGSLTVTRRIGDNNSIDLSFEPEWLRQYSSRPGFMPTSAWTYNYRLEATLNELLPWKLQLHTEFNVKQRTGYNVADMNTVDYIWNAKVSREFGSHFSTAIEGYDILGSRRSVFRSLNSQGYTESWSSQLPAYVMLHLTYKFSPK